MVKFSKCETPINDLYVIEPTKFGDDRGFFMETYNKKEFHNLGIVKDFVQDNHSKSMKGVLRGLHFQIKYPQAKLVRVLKGAVYDVVVDLRKGSPNFKNYFGIVLSGQNKKMFYIPEGFAHGFLALTQEVEFFYKVTDYYNTEYDRGIIWNDSKIMIQWPLKEYGIIEPILSERDKNLPRLNEIEIPFNYMQKDCKEIPIKNKIAFSKDQL